MNQSLPGMLLIKELNELLGNAGRDVWLALLAVICSSLFNGDP